METMQGQGKDKPMNTGFAPTTKQIDVKAARHTPWGSEDELAVTLVRSTDPPKPAVH